MYILSYLLPIDPSGPLNPFKQYPRQISSVPRLWLVKQIYYFTSRGSFHTCYPLWVPPCKPYLVYLCASLFIAHHIAPLTTFVLLFPSWKAARCSLSSPLFVFSLQLSAAGEVRVPPFHFASLSNALKMPFRQTRLSTTVRLSSSHLPRNPRSCHLCLLVCIYSLLTLAASSSSPRPPAATPAPLPGCSHAVSSLEVKSRLL